MILVAGAGGFIGGHLVARLLADGESVRAVDVKPPAAWWQLHPAAENRCLDLRDADAARAAVRGTRRVFNLASDMGGMGFIATHKADCMLSVLINTHLLQAARQAEVERYFFASSACVYPSFRQDRTDLTALAEADAYPADPEDGYGWEKLFAERLCRHFSEDFGLATRVARYHNVYGAHGAWEGGREKAPAAMCRKVAEAVRYGRDTIEIWGDGEQTRSFMHVDDCVEGTLRVIDGELADPVNVGSDELVTINRLAEVVAASAGVELAHHHVDGPQGVRGRNSDNTLIRRRLGWAPGIGLPDGIARTYPWIAAQVERAAPLRAPA